MAGNMQSVTSQSGRGIWPDAEVASRRRLPDWVDRHIAILFNIPTVAILVLMVLIPALTVVWTSLTDAHLYRAGQAQFIGLANYAAALTEPRWHQAMIQTAWFAGGAVMLQFVIGFGVALLLNMSFPGVRIWRTLFMMPMLAMSTAVSLVWMILYNSSFGPLNYWLVSAGLPGVEWLADERWAIWSLIFVHVWQWTPFMTLLLLAGLQSLPKDPYEAARIDGAGPIRAFLLITLPLMRGHIVVALVLRSIIEIKEFDTIMTMTEGGPAGATETMNMNIYLTAFSYAQLGQAAAKGVIFFALILAVQLLLLRRRKRAWSY